MLVTAQSRSCGQTSDMFDPAPLYYVYILANNSRALRTYSTDDLATQIHDHDDARFSSFIAKKEDFRLVYFEPFNSSSDAIARETELKSTGRATVCKLIQMENPRWEDLAEWEIAGSFDGLTRSDARPKSTRKRRVTRKVRWRAPTTRHRPFPPTLPRNVFPG